MLRAYETGVVATLPAIKVTVIYTWSPGRDSNPRIDGFAIHAIESLWYRDIFLIWKHTTNISSVTTAILFRIQADIMRFHIKWRTENTS